MAHDSLPVLSTFGNVVFETGSNGDLRIAFDLQPPLSGRSFLALSPPRFSTSGCRPQLDLQAELGELPHEIPERDNPNSP